jgi:FtsP/CotA-like multicopper oxidase with cupredoxin domain
VREALKRRLTFANVVAVLALFVALGGTVYAATKIDGTQIRKASIPGNRLADNSLTGKQIRERSLSSVPVAARALQANSAVNAAELGGKAASAYDPRAKWAEVDATGATGTATIVAASAGVTLLADKGADTYLDFGSSLADSHILVSPGGLTGNGTAAVPLTTGICAGQFAGAAGVDCSADVNNSPNVLKVEGPLNVLYYVVAAPNI